MGESLTARQDDDDDDDEGEGRFSFLFPCKQTTARPPRCWTNGLATLIDRARWRRRREIEGGRQAASIA